MKSKGTDSSKQWGTCLLLATVVFLFPGMATAQCSEEEMAAVFIVSGIYPGTSLQIEMLHLHRVGEATYPDEQQLLDAINAVQPGDYYLQVGLVGPLYHYFNEPMDFGGVAIIDSRDGVVTFAGTVVYMGVGEPSFPVVSTHNWNALAGSLAAPPDSLGVMNNLFWPDDFDWESQYGSEVGIAGSVLDLLRQLDVLHSFAQCGDYSAISYVYTPSVGVIQPTYAQCVVVVRGSCGPPWNGAPISIESQSWGRVKGLFR